MPIKTLNNQSSQFLGRAFPTLLKLSKGEKDSRGLPVDLDYFKAREFMNATVEKAFRDLYGEKPIEFNNVAFLGNTPDSIAPNWLEEWGSSALFKRRCDGDIMESHRMENGKVTLEPHPCKCKISGEMVCEPAMYLSLIMPDLIEASQNFGIVRLTLHAPRELSHVLVSLDAQPSTFRIPVQDCMWRIFREPADMTFTQKDGKQAKKKSYFVKIAIDMEATLAAQERRKLSSPDYIAIEAPRLTQLPATISDPETGEIIEDETPHQWTTEEMLTAFEKILADDSLQLSDDWYSVPVESLEEMLLDELVETKTPIMAGTAQIIWQAGKLYYALDLSFNENKKVILLDKPIGKNHSQGQRVSFEGLTATLSKTNGGNYAATPIS